MIDVQVTIDAVAKSSGKTRAWIYPTSDVAKKPTAVRYTALKPRISTLPAALSLKKSKTNAVAPSTKH